MPSEEKKHLESILKPCLKKHGFKKKGGTWWRHLDGFIQVVNIQGSMFSKDFYINLGVYIKALGNKDYPSECDCHVRNRLSSLSEGNEILELLDYENHKTSNLSRNKIAYILENEGLSWLNKCSTHDGAKKEYVLPNRVMTKHQRELLNKYFA